VPYPYQDWLAYNPVVHALEAIRLGFSSGYHTIASLDLLYVYTWALVMVFLGLALQIRFSERLISQ
jgi:capsular polysaccharide transport system permease protein